MIRARNVTFVLLVALTVACDRSPSAPSGQAKSTVLPPLPAATFHVSGVVTDENGQPLADVPVQLSYFEHLDDLPAQREKHVRTDGAGRYEMDIQAIPNVWKKSWLQNIVGTGLAGDFALPYTKDFQFLTASGQTVVRNFRINRLVDLAAGDPATVTCRPDDSVSSWSDFYDTLSRYVRIAVPPGDGTLTVNAVPMSGTTVPATLVVLETDDLLIWHGGAGTMNYRVKAGVEFLVVITMTPGFSQPRSYALTTSFRADNK